MIDGLKARFELAFQDQMSNAKEELGLCFMTGEPPLADAMSYSALGSGKRVRALLMLQCGKALGVEEEKLLPFAMAIEMIHAYSLIHDDLPAMDNDDFRRGRPTNHKVFGEGQAILAGDGLLSYAMMICSRYVSLTHEEEAGVSEAFAAICEAAYAMVVGQSADLLAENNAELSTNSYLERIEVFKTGALLRVPFEVAGCLASVDVEEMDSLLACGEALGKAFQIADDILDVEGDLATLGKTPGKDAENQKPTYVSVNGVAKAREKVAELTAYAVSRLDFISDNEEKTVLIDFMKSLINRNK